jgi:hypothetical protein
MAAILSGRRKAIKIMLGQTTSLELLRAVLRKPLALSERTRPADYQPDTILAY